MILLAMCGQSVLLGRWNLPLDKNSHKKFDKSHKIAAQAVAIIQKHGVILRALPGDIIGFCPPLIISKAELDDMFNASMMRCQRLQSLQNCDDA